MSYTELQTPGSPTQERSKVGIIIIAYNEPALIIHQVKCIHKFCKDKYDIIVVDNSTDSDATEAIKYHSSELGCRYIKTMSSSKGGSGSHAFAANLSYNKFKDEYQYFLYLDHDCFPIMGFSVVEILNGKMMAGLGQEKNGKTYMWPGCVMWESTIGIVNMIDFSPNGEHQLDTGGNLFKVIESVGQENCVFFDEVYEENSEFTKPPRNYYSLINKSMFMHFIAGSNWDNISDHRERINSLINILITKTK